MPTGQPLIEHVHVPTLTLSMPAIVTAVILGENPPVLEHKEQWDLRV